MTWDDYYTMLKTCVDESKTLSEEEYEPFNAREL